jgi:hypothetical protein
MIEIASDVKSIITKVENVCEDIRYMTQIKNKHEERLTNLEKIIPEDLDKRLREVEIKSYIISIIIPVAISIIMKYVNK